MIKKRKPKNPHYDARYKLAKTAWVANEYIYGPSRYGSVKEYTTREMAGTLTLFIILHLLSDF